MWLSPSEKCLLGVGLGWSVYLLVKVSIRKRDFSPYRLLYSCLCIWSFVAAVILMRCLWLILLIRFSEAEGRILAETLRGCITTLIITNGLLVAIVLIDYVKRKINVSHGSAGHGRS